MAVTIVIVAGLGAWFVYNLGKMINNVKNGRSIDGCDGDCGHCGSCHGKHK